MYKNHINSSSILYDVSKKLNVYTDTKRYKGFCNPHIIHRIVIANRVVNKLNNVEVESNIYSIGRIFDGVNKLLLIKRPRINVSLNKLEQELLTYYEKTNKSS